MASINGSDIKDPLESGILFSSTVKALREFTVQGYDGNIEIDEYT